MDPRPPPPRLSWRLGRRESAGSDADALWPPATLDRWADVAATTRVDVAGVAHGDLMNDPGAVAAVFAALEEHT